MARQAEREAKNIEVIASGATVTLRGKVHSWAEREAISGATWALQASPESSMTWKRRRDKCHREVGGGGVGVEAYRHSPSRSVNGSRTSKGPKRGKTCKVSSTMGAFSARCGCGHTRKSARPKRRRSSRRRWRWPRHHRAGDGAGQGPIAIHCDAADEEFLLVDWINALILEMATRRMLIRRFHVSLDDGALRATAWGEPIDVARHCPAVEPKGATFTELAVQRGADRWIAKCVVDV